MKKQFLLCAVMMCGLFLFTTGMSIAAEQKKEEAPEWMKYTMPGAEHRKLDSMVGKWTYTGKWWMDEKAQPEAMTGTAENKWILEGRFLQQEVSAPATEKAPAFQGIGMTGYNAMKKIYTGVWLDNMNTAMMTSTAQFDASGKTMVEQGSFSCPMTGEKDKQFRGNLKLLGKDKYAYEMYSTGKDGKEFKMMELNYVRSK